jgi:hypothetical protein
MVLVASFALNDDTMKGSMSFVQVLGFARVIPAKKVSQRECWPKMEGLHFAALPSLTRLQFMSPMGKVVLWLLT